MVQRPSMDDQDDVGDRNLAQHPSNRLQGALVLSGNKKAAQRRLANELGADPQLNYAAYGFSAGKQEKSRLPQRRVGIPNLPKNITKNRQWRTCELFTLLQCRPMPGNTSSMTDEPKSERHPAQDWIDQHLEPGNWLRIGAKEELPAILAGPLMTLAHMFQLVFSPEIERRFEAGLLDDSFSLWAAQLIQPGDGSQIVRLNDEMRGVMHLCTTPPDD